MKVFETFGEISLEFEGDCYIKSLKGVYSLKKDHVIHNETAPAIIADDGRKEWWQNNEWHRLDGPARIYKNRYKIFLINDDMFSEEEYWCHPLVVQNTIKKILEL